MKSSGKKIILKYSVNIPDAETAHKILLEVLVKVNEARIKHRMAETAPKGGTL